MAIDKLKTSCLGVDETWQGIWPSNDAASYNPLPRLEIDVDEHGPYANYNWELFFHIPLTIAVHLSKNQRFAEAQRWFHYIFDPTSNDTSVDPPERFWKFLAFRTGTSPTHRRHRPRCSSTPRSGADRRQTSRRRTKS